MKDDKKQPEQPAKPTLKVDKAVIEAAKAAKQQALANNTIITKDGEDHNP